jgi:hypothetical protein
VPRSAVKIDRYVSFEGHACDDCARRIVAAIHDCLARLGDASPWHAYFRTRLAEVERRGQDELYFVGSQVNTLRELFDEAGADDAAALLERVELECC